eukprot:7243822-Prymnesium_polylepis.2
MCDAAAVRADEAKHGPIPAGSLVCVRTGWAEARYTSSLQYCNVLDEQDIDPTHGLPRMRFPGLTAEAAELLVGERAARGVGIDSLSPDGGSCGDGKFAVRVRERDCVRCVRRFGGGGPIVWRSEAFAPPPLAAGAPRDPGRRPLHPREPLAHRRASRTRRERHCRSAQCGGRAGGPSARLGDGGYA